VSATLWRYESELEAWYAQRQLRPATVAHRALQAALRIKRKHGITVSRASLEEALLDVDVLAIRAEIADKRGCGRIDWMLAVGVRS
jgi:hypothetical protein